MSELTSKIEAIEAEVRVLTSTVDRLIREIQALKPEARSKEDALRRHRIEIELLNLRDMMVGSR